MLQLGQPLGEVGNLLLLDLTPLVLPLNLVVLLLNLIEQPGSFVSRWASRSRESVLKNPTLSQKFGQLF